MNIPGALRVEIISLANYGTAGGAISPFRLQLDCWKWELALADNTTTGWMSNWRLNGLLLANMWPNQSGNFSYVMRGGGYIHQLGNGRNAAPGNFNCYLDFTPVGGGEPPQGILTKTYYDRSLTDPDFPG
jgi:hypothetical protein